MRSAALQPPHRQDALLINIVRVYASLVLVIGATDATNLLYTTSAATGVGGILSIGLLFAAYLLTAAFLADETYGAPVRHAYTELHLSFAVLYFPVFAGVFWIQFAPDSLAELGILQLLLVVSVSLCFLIARRLSNDAIRITMQIALIVYVGSIFLDLYTKGLISAFTEDRPGGFLNNANDGAYMTSALLLLALPWKKRSATGYLLVLVALSGVLVTLSRSGLFLWFCVSVGFGISRLIHGRPVARLITLAIGIAGLIGLAIFISAPAWVAEKTGQTDNAHRIESIAQALTGDTAALNDSDRGTILQLWVEKVEQRPLFGWGSYYTMSGTGPFVAMKHLGPHNMYVARMADTGVLGVIGLVGFLLLMGAGFRARRFELGFYYTVFFAIACLFSHNLADTRPMLDLFGVLVAQSVRSLCSGGTRQWSMSGAMNAG